MEKKYLLSIDEGTSSARAIIFDLEGNILSIGRKNFEMYYPQAGWVEQDALQILDAQKQAIQEAIQMAGISSQEILTIGITNQRETVVCWNKETGKPVYNAIVWQDRRTTDFCEHLKNENLQSFIQSKTGLIIDPYFSASKLRWILKHVPEAQNLLNQGKLLWGTMDTWLLWNFTKGKVYATDVTNASRTMLFNIHQLGWDSELKPIFDLNSFPESCFPEVKNSMDDFGIYEDLGVPIGAMIGDQQSATFGQACWEEGMVKNTYGTGCFLLMNTGKKPYMSQNQLLTTIAWKIGTETTYALEGAIFSAGASIQWLEEVGIVKDVKELTALAAQVEDNGGVYLVPAFAGLGSPYWDPTARGTILGLTRGSTKAHLARAALESIAFQSQEILELMSLESGIPIKELRVDGGASQNSLLMQWQADISQVKILQPKNHETTAYGAALLAGLAHGAYSNLSQIFKQWKSLQSFEPKKNSEWSKHQMNQWKKAVQRAMHWAN